MARMEVDKADFLIRDLEKLAKLPDKVIEDMLNAGADVLVPAQRAEIQRQWSGPHSMGISAKSIKKGKVKKTKNGLGRVISVYPQGTRKRNGKTIRNGEIAFINEYGAKERNIAPRHAIFTANKKAEEAAIDAAERVYHAYLDSKNL